VDPAALRRSRPDEQIKLKEVRTPCQHLDAVAIHVAAFGEMLTGRHGERLDAWIAVVEADDLPELHSYTGGLKRDHTAVLNGLDPAAQLWRRGRPRH
jgi:hypothetical protein